MAFIVETGSGVAGATSYVSEAEAETIATDLGVQAFIDLSDTGAKQRALMQASRFLNLNYRWPVGAGPLTTTQGMGWPRAEVYDPNTGLLVQGVPQAVKEAVVILAGKIAAGVSLFADVAAGGTQQVKREKVNGIEVEYFQGNGAASPVFFGEVTQLMASVWATAYGVGGGGINQMRVAR